MGPVDRTVRAYRGAILDFRGDPRRGDAVRYVEDGLLVVREGLIAAVVAHARAADELSPDTAIEDYSGCLIVPGFIDAHVHYPQADIIASGGRQLLDWLDDYTFPAETAFADAQYAGQAAGFVLDEMLRNGTTTAAVFPSVHPASVDAFFGVAERRRLRMVSGNVLMDRNCPASMCGETEASYRQSLELIERWHGRGRLSYAVSPRFAATSTERQLQYAGQLFADHPGLVMQTHISESVEETRWVAQLFPWSASYLEVYDRYGLLRPRALFGHCIHFEEHDWAKLAAGGGAAVHCPTSNLFLGSGLFNYDAAQRAGAKVALGTDVGAGTSFSMLRTMHEAYKVARLGGRLFSGLDGFYLATLGGARALGMEDRIGSFQPDREADFVILNPRATPLLARRMDRATTLEERLFVLMMLGDDRAVEATYILGERWNAVSPDALSRGADEPKV
jgi:guanine deaminase